MSSLVVNSPDVSSVVNPPAPSLGVGNGNIIDAPNGVASLGAQTDPQSEIVRFHAFDKRTGKIRPPTEEELNKGFVNQDLQWIGGLRNRTLREDAVLDPLVQIAVERMIGQSKSDIERIATTVFSGVTWSDRAKISPDGALDATIKTILKSNSRWTFAFEDGFVDCRTMAADVEAAKNIIKFRTKLEKQLEYCDPEGRPVPTGDNFQKARLTAIILGSKESEAMKAKLEVELWEEQFRKAAEARNEILLRSGARKWSVCHIELDSAALDLPASVRVQLGGDLDVRKPHYLRYDYDKDNPAASIQTQQQERSRLAGELENQLRGLNALGSLTRPQLEAAFRVAEVPFAVELSDLNKVKVRGDARFSGPFVAARTVRELSGMISAYQTATGNSNASLFFDKDNQKLSPSTPSDVRDKLAKIDWNAGIAVEQFEALYKSVIGMEAGMGYLRPDRDVVMHSPEVNELQRAMVTQMFLRTFTLDQEWLQKVGLEIDTAIGEGILKGQARGPVSEMPTRSQVRAMRADRMQERALAREKDPLQKLLVEYYRGSAAQNSSVRTQRFGERVSILRVELADGTHLSVNNGPQNEDGNTVLETKHVIGIQREWDAIQSLEKKLSKAQEDYIAGRSTGNPSETGQELAKIEMKLGTARQQLGQLLNAHFNVQPGQLEKGVRVEVTGQMASEMLGKLSGHPFASKVLEEINGSFQAGVEPAIRSTFGVAKAIAKTTTEMANSASR